MGITFDTCRICLGKQNLCSIFEGCSNRIREKIIYCAAVQVSQDDDLPNMICNQCLFYLDVSYIFKTVCEATDKKLRDLQLTKQIIDFTKTTSNSVKHFFSKNPAKNENISDLLLMDIKNTEDENEKNNYCFDKINYPNCSKPKLIHSIVNSTNLVENYEAEKKPLSYKGVLEENGHKKVADIFEKGGNDGIYDLLVQRHTVTADDTTGHSKYHILQLDSTQNPYQSEKMDQNKDSNNSGSIKNINSSPLFDAHEGKEEDDSLVDTRLGNNFSAAEHNNTYKENTKDKVGRHIAKKITGKFPQKLNQNINIDDKQQLGDCVISEDVTLASNYDSVQHIDRILESDVPMVVFEVTVITNNQNFYDEMSNNDKHVKKRIVFEQNIDEDKTDVKSSSEAGAKKIATCNLSMKLRKGNRKVNIFSDHTKRVKGKQRLKRVKKQIKNVAEDITLNKKAKEGFKCEVCKKVFPFRSHLTRHLNMHSGIKRYTCEYCKQKFINSYNLSVHVLRHTGEFPLKCNLCDKGFPNPSLLKRHMTSHTGEAHFQCRYCSVKFTQSSSLKLHERMHLHRPSYHCDVCFKVFSYTNSLAAHKKLHFGAKRFSCDVCLSTFSRKSSLVRHMDSHTKSKVIKCRLCDLTFHSKVIYYSHLKTHCKYKCESCGEGFRNKTNLVNHVKKHEDFTCDTDLQSFRAKDT